MNHVPAGTGVMIDLGGRLCVPPVYAARTLAVQVFPLSDVRAYMGHADIQTTMTYVHHVPQVDAAERLTRLVATESAPDLALASSAA